MKILCWIHFCRMPSCKWNRFPTNRKIQNGRHRTYSIHIFVIFVYNSFVWRPWYIEMYLRCLALMIWDMTSNGTRYVIERSWVRAPPGCANFHLIKCGLFQGYWCVTLYRQIYIYLYIYLYICMVHCFDDWKSSIKLERVINANPLCWSCHIQFPWKLFGMELSHWHID